MPVTITEVTKTDVKKVNTAKIRNMNIDVFSKRVVYIISFGSTDAKGNMIEVDRKTVVVSGQDFETLAKTIGSNSKSVYDTLAEISYAYLQSKGYLTYNFK